jgi:hypothetical protein
MTSHVLVLTTMSSCSSEGLDALNSMSMLVEAHHHAETGSHSAFLFWLVCSIKDSKDDLLSESIRKAIEPEQDCTTVLVHHTPKDGHEDENSNICECVGKSEGQIREGNLGLGL